MAARRLYPPLSTLPRKFWAIGILALVAIAAIAQRGSNTMEYKTKVLLNRYGPPPSGEAKPNLTIFHSANAWNRFVNNEGVTTDELQKLSVDWKGSVVLLVRSIAEGGMDLYPSIVSLRRQGDTVDVQVEMVRNPTGTGLDVQVQPWLIAEAPAEAFGGAPQIRFQVKGQGAGTVSQER
jgi:hypothetical protein